MDPDIEELKKLVQENIALSKDTNHIVHGMRRNARWSRFAKVVWWVAIFAISAAAYYLYLQPYLIRLEQMYSTVQTGSQQAQNYQQQFADFFKQFTPKTQ